MQELPKLPFPEEALIPVLSKETITYHYGKHHANYVNTLNQLISNTEFATKTLEAIIKSASGPIFNNAAQVWNHTFYWHCLATGVTPSSNFVARIKQDFGTWEHFQEAFMQAGVSVFGSGWVWLVQDGKTLKIVATHNADNPLLNDQRPLLTCDVWEHAYYIDYRNARAKYLESFWQIVNWQYVEQQLV